MRTARRLFVNRNQRSLPKVLVSKQVANRFRYLESNAPPRRVSIPETRPDRYSKSLSTRYRLALQNGIQSVFYSTERVFAASGV